MNKTALTWVIVIVVLIILGVIIWGGGNANDLGDININDTDTNTPDMGDTEGDVSGVVVGNNAVNVDVQALGSTARISMVVLESPGFAVVHAPTPTGNPGPVIGASALLPAGQSNNVAVSLNTPLADGQRYIVMLHLDNGDGAFSEASDPAARDMNNNPILMEFEADADADSGNTQSI